MFSGHKNNNKNKNKTTRTERNWIDAKQNVYTKIVIYELFIIRNMYVA